MYMGQLMGAGGKGGSQTTRVQVPAWLEDAAQQNLSRADRVSQIGYTPYYGPDVAAMTPMQIASMQNTGQAANAFGMASADPMAGLPQAQTFAGGVQGYSSAPLYEQSLAALEANRPGQYDAITGMFINPQTGALPAYPFATGQGSAPASPAVPAAGGGSSGGPDGRFGMGPVQQHAGGGYAGLVDMFNGGGPGASGNTFSGGIASGVANTVGVRPVGSGSSGMGGGK